MLVLRHCSAEVWRAWLPGSAFTRDLPPTPEKWYDSKSYCAALEPLLRLAMQDAQHFSDLTGEEGKPQVPRLSKMSDWYKSLCPCTANTVLIRARFRSLSFQSVKAALAARCNVMVHAGACLVDLTHDRVAEKTLAIEAALRLTATMRKTSMASRSCVTDQMLMACRSLLPSRWSCPVS